MTWHQNIKFWSHIPFIGASLYKIFVSQNMTIGTQKIELEFWDKWGQMLSCLIACDGLSVYLDLVVYVSPVWELWGCW